MSSCEAKKRISYTKMQRVQLILKCLVDYFAAILLVVLLSPIFLIIALTIKIDSRGPILFKQQRVGKAEKLFTIYKFRSMIPDASDMGLGLKVAQNDARITPVGHFLRRTSLDELPQLLNILKGDMSFIGPRPTLLCQVKQYNDFQKKRLLIKPGITGWAQVNGRNSLSWPERIVLDVWYVEHFSLWLDYKILLKTMRVIWVKDGLYGKEGINEDF